MVASAEEVHPSEEEVLPSEVVLPSAVAFPSFVGPLVVPLANPCSFPNLACLALAFPWEALSCVGSCRPFLLGCDSLLYHLLGHL